MNQAQVQHPDDPNTSVPREVIETITRLTAPIVITHVRPDADALGSMFAVAIAFARDSTSPKVSLPEGCLSRRLTFLSDWAGAVVATPEDFTSADGFIAVDTARRSRCLVDRSLVNDDWSAGKPLIIIDHHATNKLFGTVNWVAGNAGSTAELVYRLLCAANLPITPTIASLLYAGIHSDTIGFSLPTTSASALEAAADLARCGARVGEIGDYLCRNQSKPEFDLHRLIYANTRLIENGLIAYSTASLREIRDAGCTVADIDEQIAIPRSLNGAKLAMLLTEGTPGQTRINFRGTGNLTVVDLAGKFGGGGHSQAAGAVLDCGLEQALEQVLPKAIAYVEEHVLLDDQVHDS